MGCVQVGFFRTRQKGYVRIPKDWKACRLLEGGQCFTRFSLFPWATHHGNVMKQPHSGQAQGADTLLMCRANA